MFTTRSAEIQLPLEQVRSVQVCVEVPLLAHTPPGYTQFVGVMQVVPPLQSSPVVTRLQATVLTMPEPVQEPAVQANSVQLRVIEPDSSQVFA